MKIGDVNIVNKTDSKGRKHSITVAACRDIDDYIEDGDRGPWYDVVTKHDYDMLLKEFEYAANGVELWQSKYVELKRECEKLKKALLPFGTCDCGKDTCEYSLANQALASFEAWEKEQG